MNTKPKMEEENKRSVLKKKKYIALSILGMLAVSFAPSEIPGSRISYSYGCGNERIGATCSKTTAKYEPFLLGLVKEALGIDRTYDKTKHRNDF